MYTLRFIKWWWKTSDFVTRFNGCTGVAVITLLPNLLVFGVKAFVIWLITVLSLSVLVLLCYLCAGSILYIKEKHKEYIEEKDRESNEIVSRLKGCGNSEYLTKTSYFRKINAK